MAARIAVEPERSCGDRSQEAAQLAVVDPGQGETAAPTPREVHDGGAEVRGQVRRRGPVAGDEQHRRVRQGPAEVTEEEQCRGLGPAQVVEDQRQGSARRRPPEGVGGRLEQQVALGRVVHDDRRRGPQPVGQPRRDAEELAATAFALLA